jgi:hypothetical protein
MYSSLLSYLLPLTPKYVPQHPILHLLQHMSVPQCERLSFTPIKNNRQNCISLYLSFIFFDRKLEDRRFAPNNSKNSLISICSQFLQERNFDSLGLLTNVCNVPPVQRSYYLHLRCDFVLHSRLETRPFTQFSQHSF